MIVEHLCIVDALAVATVLSGATCRLLKMALLGFFRDRYDAQIDVVRVRRQLVAALGARVHVGGTPEWRRVIADDLVLRKFFRAHELDWSVEPAESVRVELKYRAQCHQLLDFGCPSSRRKYSHLFFPRVTSNPFVYAIVKRESECTQLSVYVRFVNEL